MTPTDSLLTSTGSYLLEGSYWPEFETITDRATDRPEQRILKLWEYPLKNLSNGEVEEVGGWADKPSKYASSTHLSGDEENDNWSTFKEQIWLA